MTSSGTGQAVMPSIEEIFPPHDFGNWPDGFTARRDQLYGDGGR